MRLVPLPLRDFPRRQGAQMLLRGKQGSVGLRVGNLRIVHQFVRQRSLLKEFLPVVQQFLGSFLRLPGRALHTVA